MLQCDVERTCRHPFALIPGFKRFFSAVSLAGLVLRCFQNNLEASCCRDAQKAPRSLILPMRNLRIRKFPQRIGAMLGDSPPLSTGLPVPRGPQTFSPAPSRLPGVLPKSSHLLPIPLGEPPTPTLPFSLLSVHTHLVLWLHHRLPSIPREVQVAHPPPPLHLPAAPLNLAKMVKS